MGKTDSSILSHGKPTRKKTDNYTRAPKKLFEYEAARLSLRNCLNMRPSVQSSSEGDGNSSLHDTQSMEKCPERQV